MKHLNNSGEKRANQEFGRMPARNGQSPYSKVIIKKKKEERDCCPKVIHYYSNDKTIIRPTVLRAHQPQQDKQSMRMSDGRKSSNASIDRGSATQLSVLKEKSMISS